MSRMVYNPLPAVSPGLLRTDQLRLLETTHAVSAELNCISARHFYLRRLLVLSTALFRHLAKSKQQDLNLRPLEPKSSALPIELCLDGVEVSPRRTMRHSYFQVCTCFMLTPSPVSIYRLARIVSRTPTHNFPQR